ncbi:MAG: adenylate cyclase [Pseudonocardiales bacterium]|jgi:adenylate cyclase|nr:adenylate cyclase [Pseudonocardiales bacterium]
MTEPSELDVADAAAAAQLDIAAVVDSVEERLLRGPRRYTRLQIAKQAGVPADEARRLWRALGFATVEDDNAVMFTDGDLDALMKTQVLAEHGISDTAMLLGMTRMFGQTFSRLAEWQGRLLIELLAEQPELLQCEDDVLHFIDELVPVLESLQAYVWRRQLSAYFSRIASSEAAMTGEAPAAVGFADMSGFTTLTRKATEAELRDLLEAFESTATDIVGAHNGRIVKALGDEVLFVASSEADAAEIAIGLQAAAEEDPRLPPLRIGLAAGPVVSRMGDVYGSTVNIASRLTSLCRPGWILVDRMMSEALSADDRYSLKPRRPEAVRGFHHLHQWRLKRRAESAPRTRGG